MRRDFAHEYPQLGAGPAKRQSAALTAHRMNPSAELQPPSEVTQWLQALGAASPQASSQLFEMLYEELRRVARFHLRRENPGHTLSATSLAHEAWFRMAEQTRTQWQNRSHFLAVASTMMRRILVNHELARRAKKRDAEWVSATLAGLEDIGAAPDRDLVAVHEALLAFEEVDKRAAKVVELRFFGGMDNEEVAQALGISLATVKRDWTVARAWLRRALAH
jgi:RNA polymerase sigma factor (TIGR02999 family)